MKASKPSSYLKASFKDRLIAYVLDKFILFVPTYILLRILRATSVSFSGLAGVLLGIFIAIAYRVWFTDHDAATPGKKMLKLKVLSTDYKKAPSNQILIRESVGRIVSFVANLGYLWMLIDKDQQTFHDKLTHTVVVKVDDKGKLIPTKARPVNSTSWFSFITLFILGIPFFLTSIFLYVFLYISKPVRVTGESMAPNYHAGQAYLTNRLAYRFSEPKRGDVVLFMNPQNTTQESFKRVIGLPEEQITIRGCEVFINGNLLKEEYVMSGSCTKSNMQLVDYLIPKNSYFLMGDNREHSVDSRNIGVIPRSYILGQFLFRYH